MADSCTQSTTLSFCSVDNRLRLLLGCVEQGHHQGLAIEAGKGDARRVRQPLGLRGVHDEVGPVLAQPVLEPIA